MNERSIARIATQSMVEGHTVTGVLLAGKGGWVFAPTVRIVESVFSGASPDEPTIWKITLLSKEGVPLRDYYSESDGIAGIQVERTNSYAEQE